MTGRDSQPAGQMPVEDTPGVQLDYGKCEPESSLLAWIRWTVRAALLMGAALVLFWSEWEFRRRFHRGGPLIGARPTEIGLSLLAAAVAAFGAYRTKGWARFALLLTAGAAMLFAGFLCLAWVPYRDR